MDLPYGFLYYCKTTTVDVESPTASKSFTEQNWGLAQQHPRPTYIASNGHLL